METTLTTFNASTFLNRIKLVLFSPKECWKTIAAEQTQPKELVVSTLAPLIILGILCTTIGMQLFGINLGPMGTWRAPFFSFFISQIVSGCISIGMVFLSALIAQKLAGFFQGAVSYDRAFSLVGHAMIPSLASSVLGLFPPLTLFSIILLGVSLYALYHGVTAMTSVPESSRLSYVASFVVTMLLLGMIISGLSMMLGVTPRPGTLQ